jgi:hypothetical protein
METIQRYRVLLEQPPGLETKSLSSRHKIQPSDPILTQLSPVHIFADSFSKVCVNIAQVPWIC